jgi:tetratricopeptide (TPR) repeat protein
LHFPRAAHRRKFGTSLLWFGTFAFCSRSLELGDCRGGELLLSRRFRVVLDHLKCAMSRDSLDQALNRPAEAETLFKRALAIKEKALGPEHKDVAEALFKLAELYRAQGRYADAEPLYTRALAIGEKALGPDDLTLAVGLNGLGLLYHTQGRYAEAEPLYKRALSIRERSLGPDHLEVGLALNNLAELYRLQGRYPADADRAAAG